MKRLLMVDLEHNRIILGDLNEKVRKYEVWWRTTSGLHKVLIEAVEATKASGLPMMSIIPIAVAISDSTYEPLS